MGKQVRHEETNICFDWQDSLFLQYHSDHSQSQRFDDPYLVLCE